MNNKKGFSLIEVIVTVVVISFLTAFILPYFRAQIHKTNDSKRKAELKRIGQALEEYEKDFSCYPANTGILTGYIDNIPRDPVFKTAYAYETDGTTCSKWYKLFSRLEYTKDPDYKPSIGPTGLPKVFNYVVTSPNAP